MMAVWLESVPSEVPLSHRVLGERTKQPPTSPRRTTNVPSAMRTLQNRHALWWSRPSARIGNTAVMAAVLVLAKGDWWATLDSNQ